MRIKETTKISVTIYTTGSSRRLCFHVVLSNKQIMQKAVVCMCYLESMDFGKVLSDRDKDGYSRRHFR